MNRFFTLLIRFSILSVISTMDVQAQNTCNCWIKHDSSFHVVPFSGFTPPYYRNDDGSSNLIILPFKFCFWGRQTDSVFINNNGNITFGESLSQFSADTFPYNNNVPMIAAFWADVDTYPGNLSYPSSDAVYYSITPTHMVVQWDSVGFVGPLWCVSHPHGYGDYDTTNTFQIIITNGNDPILPKGNNVELCYENMQWTTGADSPASDCLSHDHGFHGDPANVGANEGDGVRSIQIGLFDTNSATYVGQFPPAPSYDGVYWLINKSFLFNLCKGTIAPLTSGISPCDTFKICLGDSVLIPLYFLSPVQGDSVWSNLSPPVPAGVHIFSNKPGATDSLTILVVGSSANMGYHTVYVYGYDNQLPQDTTYTSFVIEVDSTPNVHLYAMRDTICLGDTSTLTVSGGKFYTWSTGATSSVIKVTPSITQSYTIGVSNGGCTKDSIIQVVVLTKPSPLIIAKPDTVCSGDSVLLMASGGGSYKWNTGQTKDSIWVNPDSTKIYSVNASNGYCSDSAKISVFVNKKGVSGISLSKDSLCPFDTAILTASGGVGYKWSNGSTASSIIVIPGTTETYTLISIVSCGIDTLVKKVTVIPLPVPNITGTYWKCKGVNDTLTVTGGGTYLWSNGSTKTSYFTGGIYADSTIYVTVKNNSGCIAKDSFKITLRPAPVIGITPATICSGCITIADTIAGSGYTYYWSNGGTSSNDTVCPSSSSNYTLTVSNGCISKKVTTVDVYYPALIACCPKTISPGGADTITADSSLHYNWSPNSGLNCDTCKTVIASPTVTTTYTVTGNNSDGCQSVREITVTVEIICDDFTVPNVFTPNNDNINDKFVITTKNLDSYSILIYDRWGKEMYKSTNPLVYWDGYTESGAKALDGVYYYIIHSTCSNNNYDKQGFVQLIR